MNRLSVDRRARVLAALVDGVSIRATCRMMDVSKPAVLKLLADVGEACLDYQRTNFVNLPCERLQCDEIWSFIGAKQKNVRPTKRIEKWGDCWTWVALCADTKVVPTWLVGPRNEEMAIAFLADLAPRLHGRVQVTTDGLMIYEAAVANAFTRDGVDYGQIRKIFGMTGTTAGSSGRYSPPPCIGAEREAIFGTPNYKHISTSYVERQNMTMRMHMRRFTRLSNAFSKKLENHIHAVAIHYFNYNFCRIHQTTRISPAMAAGVDLHLWSLAEVAEMADSYHQVNL